MPEFRLSLEAQFSHPVRIHHDLGTQKQRQILRGDAKEDTEVSYTW